MSSHEYVRTDSETAEAVSRAMKILAEYGYMRARAFFNEAGIKADLAERMLLMRYDRRRPTPDLLVLVNGVDVPTQSGHDDSLCIVTAHSVPSCRFLTQPESAGTMMHTAGAMTGADIEES